MGFLSGKKETGKVETAVEVVAQPETAPDEAVPLQALAARFDDIGQTLDELGKQLAAYLIRREAKAAAPAPHELPAALGERLDLLSKKLDQLALSPGPRDASAAAPAATFSPEAIQAAVRPLQERLEQLDNRLKALAPPSPTAAGLDPLVAALAQVRQAVHEQRESLGTAFRQLQQGIEQRLAELAQYFQPKEPEKEETSFAGSTEWQRAILGRELAEHPALDFQRQQLINGVLEGSAGACAFAGQLLAFQSSPPEKMPALLKEIGEAYYRWQPKTRPGTTPMEEVLVHWLSKTCAEAGISNTIDLVDPGERFDSTRHTANQRGVEITAVHGWVVLKDNGKVYTRANVSVK